MDSERSEAEELQPAHARNILGEIRSNLPSPIVQTEDLIGGDH